MVCEDEFEIRDDVVQELPNAIRTQMLSKSGSTQYIESVSAKGITTPSLPQLPVFNDTQRDDLTTSNNPSLPTEHQKRMMLKKESESLLGRPTTQSASASQTSKTVEKA